MFVDYYNILGIEYPSFVAEIKAAYIKQVKIWHPDRNIGKNTHERMVLINEARLILLDPEAKQLYDIEYQVFSKVKHERKTEPKESQHHSEESEFESSYQSQNETLNQWMTNAKRQAKVFAKESLDELVSISSVAFKEGGVRLVGGIVGYLIMGTLFSLIFGMSKGCN